MKRASACVTQRLLKSWRGLRSFARVTVCNIEDGGGKGGEGLGGAKLQAADNQRKSVLVFARRVRQERVRLLCLVSVGVGASLRRWFAWASARSLRQNWRWLKLARTQNRGRAAAPSFWQLKVGPPRGPVIGPGERRSQKDYGAPAAWNVYARRF